VTAQSVAALTDVFYADVLRYVSKVPDDVFIASEATKRSLVTAIQTAQGR
jgi:hypothetical protein